MAACTIERSRPDGGMADAEASKASVRKGVRVRVPLRARRGLYPIRWTSITAGETGSTRGRMGQQAVCGHKLVPCRYRMASDRMPPGILGRCGSIGRPEVSARRDGAGGEPHQAAHRHGGNPLVCLPGRARSSPEQLTFKHWRPHSPTAMADDPMIRWPMPDATPNEQQALFVAILEPSAESDVRGRVAPPRPTTTVHRHR